MRAETMHKMCLGKAAYKKWGKAEKTRLKWLKQGIKQYIYWCPVCLRFHLSREKPETKQRQWNKYEQWCIDNCLKYPDASIDELKAMALDKIKNQSDEELAKQSIQLQRILYGVK